MTIFEKAKVLHGLGYYIGPRDPLRNQAFLGKFMVCQDVDEGPTMDAGRGGFCIVGDNLGELVDDAFNLSGL